jgi:hypothetical protein
MISTGLSIIEYIKQCKVVDTLDVCDFIEQNAQNIINNTIDDMNDDPPAEGPASSKPPEPEADASLDEE